MADITTTILLFATLKDLAATRQITLELHEHATIDDVRQQVIAKYPQLHPALNSAIAAVNKEYVFAGHRIQDKDEIAFFPPVSGGSWPTVCWVAEAPLDLNAFTAQIVTPATGAVALFSGYVRGQTTASDQIVQTAYLEYEAYHDMALEKMQLVAAEIRQQWPLVQGIAIVQRIGKLQVSEPTVLIACAAGHRDQGCFEAARYGIDRLKQIVPVWKKEIHPDGTHWVEGTYHPTPNDTQP